MINSVRSGTVRLCAAREIAPPPQARLSLAIAIGLAVGIGLVGPAAAQAPAPTACTAPEFRQFDFWVGEWNVTGATGKVAGTNTVDRSFGDCVIQEHWSGTGGDQGTSLNTYDVSHKRWHQTWVDNQGQFLQLDGIFAADTMTLSGDAISKTGHAYVNRIRWSREGGDPNKVRQIWDSSTDGGKTWKIVFNGLYVRKASG